MTARIAFRQATAWLPSADLWQHRFTFLTLLQVTIHGQSSGGEYYWQCVPFTLQGADSSQVLP